MAESGKSDRWNSLLETLGVPASEPKSPPAAEKPEEGSAAAPPRPQPASLLRPEKPKAAPKPKPAKPAAKSPSYWSRIAGALGLEVPAEPEPAPAAPEPAAEVPQPARAEEVEPVERPHRGGRHERREEEPARGAERPPRGGRRQREESFGREREPREREPRESEPAPRSKLDELFGPKEPDVDVFGLGRGEDEPRLREPGAQRERGDEESGPVLDYEGQGESGRDLPLDERAEGSFERGGEEGGERDGRRRRRRRRGRGRRGAGEARGEGAAPRHEEDIEPAGEEADFDYDRDVDIDRHEMDRDLEMDLDGERREDAGARQRPQRGGRRDRDEQEEDRYPPASERAGEDRPYGERPRRERAERAERGSRGRGRGDEGGRPPSRGDERGGRPASERSRGEHVSRQRVEQARGAREDDLDAGLPPDLDDGDETGGSPTHKKIPTWEEAVNILIDANMASRSNAPDRERGRGRGRGRR